MTRAFQWVTFVLADLVAIGVVLQVYFIAAYFFGAADALDVHEGLGGAVHGVEILVFLAAIGAFWKRWGLVGLALSLPVIGTVQLAFTESDEGWVGGLHGLLAVAVLVIAAVIGHRAMHALGIGRGAGTPAGG